MKTKNDILKGMASYYGKALDEKGLEIYAHMLKKYTMEQVANAATEALKNEDKFPLYPTLLKYLDAEKLSDLEDRAIEQSNYCKVHFSTGASSNFSDPITERIMRTTMPFADWAQRSAEDVAKYFQGQFVKEYKKIAQSNIERAKLKNKNELGTAQASPDSHISDDMKIRRQWVKDLEKKSGETYDRYQLHQWAIYEGADQGGYIVKFDDPAFIEKLKASERFKFDFPRSHAIISGVAEHLLPPAKPRLEGRILSNDEAAAAIGKILAKLREINAKFKAPTTRGCKVHDRDVRTA